jgi:hypothetical protein
VCVHPAAGRVDSTHPGIDLFAAPAYFIDAPIHLTNDATHVTDGRAHLTDASTTLIVDTFISSTRHLSRTTRRQIGSGDTKSRRRAR